MNRQTLVNGLLSITAISFMTGCVDDKYDLTDIDTTSRFTVDALTVPVNLSEIKLENVVNLDDNDLIEKVVINGKECYSIKQSGDIAPTEFSIGSVEVAAPHIDPTLVNVAIPQLPSSVGLPSIPAFDVDLPASDLKGYDFKMENVNEALKVLKGVKTASDITIDVELSVPSQLLGAGNKISFKDLKLQLPWGLVTDYKESGENQMTYEKNTGLLTVPEVAVNSEGKAYVSIKASGLELGSKGKVENGILAVSGEVGIIGGKINIDVKNVTLPSSLEIVASYNVSGFKLASFSGDIDYKMEGIHIAPISLNNLPSFLDSPETNLIIADPQILVSIKNPVGEWLDGKGVITLTSHFKNGEDVEHKSGVFTLSGENAKIAFCSKTNAADYDLVEFPGLRTVLSNGNSGLPSSIEVSIEDINFAGEVTDFPLGDLGSAEGHYEFNAPLGFGDGSVVIYETTEGDWGSEDLDKVNINKIHLDAKCTTNLPVSIHLTIIPVDKHGNEIAIKEENRYFEVPAMAIDHHLTLNIESVNGPIKYFNGVKFIATVEQNSGNTDAIGPNLKIDLKDLRVTVDGYYETDF